MSGREDDQGGGDNARGNKERRRERKREIERIDDRVQESRRPRTRKLQEARRNWSHSVVQRREVENRTQKRIVRVITTLINK